MKRVITHANSPRFHFFAWVLPALYSAGVRLPGICEFKVNHSENPPPRVKKVKRKKLALTTASLLASSPFIRIESQLLRHLGAQHPNEWPEGR